MFAVLDKYYSKHNYSMINIKDLHFTYKGGAHEVLSGIDLGLSEGKIYGLLGKNGEGKSTLLYLVCGMLRATEGGISVFGMESKERNAEMLRDIFLVPEEFQLPDMSLKAYLEMNRSFYPDFSDEVFFDCLKEFELPSDVKLKRLSMGQKKKVYMSIALAAGTRLLLMDEPTNGLDIPSKKVFRQVVARHMNENRTIIISTHQVHDIASLIDHIVILNNHQIAGSCPVSDVTDRFVFELRRGDEPMDDVVYSEASLQGSAVIADRGSRPETALDLELLFNAVVGGCIKL